MKRKWLKINIDSLLSSIAYKEANGYDFEANTLKGLIVMTESEKRTYERYLYSCIDSKKRREQGYPETTKVQ